MSLREAAPAKVNLFLHVTGRRADGYHLLDSLAVFGPAADELRGESASSLSLRVEGPFGCALAGEADNLVLRAARALAERGGVSPRAALTLVKRLPVASGIGGGSADAAAALRLLNRAWGLSLDETELREVALPLGADIPVCVASRAARMGGVGDVITEAPALPRCGLLLVNPGVALPTPEVFRARSGGFSPPAALPAAWPDAAAMAADLAQLGNDLEAPAVGLRPPIGEVLSALRALPGCLLARMSGSGATCFGLFATAEEARATCDALPAAWWREGGALTG
ncbi:4-(cytidine 5'-diphospho)-2-C-methyl-D-erythritol kinase [Sabulicella glaciei]|uniref:4-diphosphocytidyl-2-C-methyl-D-erythritol kinase n=1 Tax=Sabulicella glaciei TaxID=2984948 RepID=A0ABT3NZR0_9PROT|nr:4-(cytidine 5'-diphospho)-2-C-methyl-D-erythritol kinase [Roseococcus sp. MDT2-1-1]